MSSPESGQWAFAGLPSAQALEEEALVEIRISLLAPSVHSCLANPASQERALRFPRHHSSLIPAHSSLTPVLEQVLQLGLGRLHSLRFHWPQATTGSRRGARFALEDQAQALAEEV